VAVFFRPVNKRELFFLQPERGKGGVRSSVIQQPTGPGTTVADFPGHLQEMEKKSAMFGGKTSKKAGGCFKIGQERGKTSAVTLTRVTSIDCLKELYLEGRAPREGVRADTAKTSTGGGFFPKAGRGGGGHHPQQREANWMNLE